jgi:hypothetical protein
MTDPKEKRQKPAIPTRAPGKKGEAGIFDNLRPVRPHPMEEILGLVPMGSSAPTRDPGLASQILLPQESSTQSPTATPTNSPIHSPIHSPTDNSKAGTPGKAPPNALEAPKRSQWLDATHTQSEQVIYNNMYRLTLSFGNAERHFTVPALQRLTGIRSHITVRKAIDGLLEKKSIAVVAYRNGDPVGPRYCVYTPAEIAQRRKAANIEIDTQTKRLRTPTTPTDSPTDRAIDSPNDSASKSVGVSPTTPTDSVGHVLIHEENHDDDLVAALRALFPTEPAERLARTVTELHTILAAFVERAASRASEPPVHSAFITKCVRTALAARDAVERLRTPRSPAKRDPGAVEAPDVPEDPVYQIRKIAVQLREMHRAEGGYSGTDLRDDVKEVCATAGIAFDDALLEEALGKVGL